MVNIDGFVLTHSYEQVIIPTKEQIKKYLPKYNPKPGQFLDPKNPLTMGSFATPAHYMEIREDLHNDLLDSQKNIKEAFYIPANPQTEIQQTNRNKWKEAVASWNGLTDIQKEVYNEKAKGKPLTGHNLYVKQYMLS